MNNRPVWLCGAFVLATLLTIPCFGAKASDADRFLDRFMFTLESGLVFPRQARQLQKYTRSDDPGIRIRAISLLAQYMDEVEEQPLAALKLVAQHVLEEEDLQQWLSDLKKNRNARNPGQDAPELTAEFPDVSKWNMDYPELCVETGRILTGLGEHQTAVAAFDRVGRNLKGTPQVLAAEGGGDLLVKIQRYTQAIDWYDFALGVISQTVQEREYVYDIEEVDEILELIKKRIIRKKAEAQDLLDTERYGPGFVMYRKARTYEIQDRDYLLAAVAYQKILDSVPDTVYSEAAILYKGKCLLKLSSKQERDKAGRHISKEEKELKALNIRFKKYGKRLSRRVRIDLQAEIERKAWLFMELKSVPLGRKAAETSLSKLEQFIEDK